jgi:hypothetical protein
LASAAGWAQQSQKAVQPERVSIDVAVVSASELSRPDPSLGSFWFRGGGVDAAATFWKGFGIAATLTGDHASNVFTGVDENKISFLAGPRYTFTAYKWHAGAEDPRRLQLYGQGLVGVAHGFDFAFSNGSTSANELAIQTGGGLNLYLTRNFGVRPVELEFVRTQIGATGFSTQNDFRVATGVTYRFGGVRLHR